MTSQEAEKQKGSEYSYTESVRAKLFKELLPKVTKLLLWLERKEGRNCQGSRTWGEGDGGKRTGAHAGRQGPAGGVGAWVPTAGLADSAACPQVDGIHEMQWVMRWNDFLQDPITDWNPVNAIAARGDLKAPGPNGRRKAFGAIDSKVSSAPRGFSGRQPGALHVTRGRQPFFIST